MRHPTIRKAERLRDSEKATRDLRNGKGTDLIAMHVVFLPDYSSVGLGRIQ